MRLKNILITLPFFLTSIISYSQVLNDEERKLYTLIMEYRRDMGLPNIPLSASLTFVAQTHVKDLANYHNEGDTCNMHSWSSNGSWTSCCYTPNHAKASCMWAKPRELTSYQGNGYEISFGSFGGNADSKSALNTWKSSSGHNAVILNQGVWNEAWNAIGIGLYKGYAVVWFGKEIDNK